MRRAAASAAATVGVVVATTTTNLASLAATTTTVIRHHVPSTKPTTSVKQRRGPPGKGRGRPPPVIPTTEDYYSNKDQNDNREEDVIKSVDMDIQIGPKEEDPSIIMDDGMEVVSSISRRKNIFNDDAAVTTQQILPGIRIKPRTAVTDLDSKFELRCQGAYSAVIGVDEAGRGPLAGPLMVAACALPPHVHLSTPVNDSKQLRESEREALYEELAELHNARDIVWAVAKVSIEEIDRVNILQATLAAMSTVTRTVVAALPHLRHSYFDQPSTITGQPVRVLLDGDKVPKDFAGDDALRADCVVKGDAKVRSIAVASIIANVCRNRLMNELEHQYPGYGFAQHKGYGTAAHMEAIRRLGPCPAHRASFEPVRGMLEPRRPGEKKKEEGQEEKSKVMERNPRNNRPHRRKMMTQRKDENDGVKRMTTGEKTTVIRGSSRRRRRRMGGVVTNGGGSSSSVDSSTAGASVGENTSRVLEETTPMRGLRRSKRLMRVK